MLNLPFSPKFNTIKLEEQIQSKKKSNNNESRPDTPDCIFTNVHSAGLHIVYIGISTFPPHKHHSLFFTKSPLKSVNCLSPLFRQSSPIYWFFSERSP